MKKKSLPIHLALMSLTLVLTALSSASVRADTRATDTQALESALAQVPCVGNICLGAQVQVISGQFYGQIGSVTGVDVYNQMIRIVNQSGYSLNVYAYEARAIGGAQSSCTGNVCVGDSVRVLVGPYSGAIGYVVATNDFAFTATVQIQGGYVTFGIRDIGVLNQSPRPYPQPMPPRPYPQPRPHPQPAPRPHPIPQPPRHPQPAPRGPGRVDPPRRAPVPSRPAPRSPRSGRH